MKGSGRHRQDQRAFLAQVRECRDKGYLLSPKKIGSRAFSKVYLAYATHERMQHNTKLYSDLRGKRHTMVAVKVVSTAEAPAEFSRKFLPREISSLNATYKHLNVVQLYETYQNSQRSYLVRELAARGNLLEHTNAVSDRRGHRPGLEEEEARGLFWQLVSAVAHCHNAGVVHPDLKCENILLDDRGLLKLTDFGFASCSGLKNALLSTFRGSAAYGARDPHQQEVHRGASRPVQPVSAAPGRPGAGSARPEEPVPPGRPPLRLVSTKLPFQERQPHRMLRLVRRGRLQPRPVPRGAPARPGGWAAERPRPRTGPPGVGLTWPRGPPPPAPCDREGGSTPGQDGVRAARLPTPAGASRGGTLAAGVWAGVPAEPAECRDLIRGLFQLRRRARLGLQQVAAHCWMLPGAHALSRTVLAAGASARRGAAQPSATRLISPGVEAQLPAPPDGRWGTPHVPRAKATPAAAAPPRPWHPPRERPWPGVWLRGTHVSRG